MTARAPAPIDLQFRLNGTVEPLLKGTTGPQGHRPARSLGGWLMVYALIGPTGGLQPVRDRDGHVMEAAKELGRIDWTEYLRKGTWNDHHNEDVVVGHGSNLEFHDETTPLAQSHRKVGFWTSGHLWDRADPASWELYTERRPSEVELQRADELWGLAQCLKGTPRPLGFSAHGMMRMSACGRRALAAQCDAAAICELPKNPATTAEPMMLAAALDESPLAWMRKGQVERHDSPCRSCTCPPGAACLVLRKGLRNESRIQISDPRDIVPDDPAAAPGAGLEGLGAADKVEALIQMIQFQYFVSRADGVRWIANYLGSKADQESSP
jgi:hypothetical protein